LIATDAILQADAAELEQWAKYGWRMWPPAAVVVAEQHDVERTETADSDIGSRILCRRG
jgi:hypothetical protein